MARPVKNALLRFWGYTDKTNIISSSDAGYAVSFADPMMSLVLDQSSSKSKRRGLGREGQGIGVCFDILIVFMNLFIKLVIYKTNSSSNLYL